MKMIRVPETVEQMSSATVRRWLVEQGQQVSAGEILVELEIEQASIELASAQGGVVRRIMASAGQTVEPGAGLCELEPVEKTGSASSGGSGNDVSVNAAVPSGQADAPVVPILMPQVGNSMEEGTIVSWKVAPGDRIAEGQVIFEIETDKAVVEVEATDAGRLARIVVEEDQTVQVKQPVAYLSESDAAVERLLGRPQSTVAVAQPPQQDGQAPAGPSVDPGPEPTLPDGVIPVLMPQAGNSMEEGTIVAWQVAEGDRVTEGQILYEIETDKATVEVEATDAGTIARIVTEVDDVVPVKQPVAYLADDQSKVDDYLQAYRQWEQAKQSVSQSVSTGGSAAGPSSGGGTVSLAPAAMTDSGRVKASPAARRLAAERGLDLQSIAGGSGPGGRILSTDLDKAQPVSASGGGGVGQIDGEYTRKPMSRMRRAIASNLVASKQNVPHFYVRLTIDADPLFAYYKQMKPEVGCTLNDVIVLAVGKTIGSEAFAGFRSQMHGNELLVFDHASIGIAVGVEDGLVVPVVLDVDTLSLGTLAEQTKQLVEGARKGRVENMGRGNFTISNMGMFGVEEFAAIINPPESGILAVSAVRQIPVVKDDQIVPGRVMTMTLSCDHRVVDGMLAAQFLARLKEVLQAPAERLG